ncbi:MAG: dTDP-4-dehydrorhamnose 3,5-epimerase [Pseudomonadota bacterium]
MDVEPLGIPGPCLIRPRRFGDARGVLSETYQRDRYRAAGIDADFVQDNLSLSTRRGTVRGLHFQAPPAGQAKLVQCVRGAVFDVAVDLRTDSAEYGAWTSATLTAEGGEQIFVPDGFAHGFMTLEPDTIVTYKASAAYDPDAEGGLRWDDPDLAIDWPVLDEPVTLSDRDGAWAPFAAFETPFAERG